MDKKTYIPQLDNIIEAAPTIPENWTSRKNGYDKLSTPGEENDCEDLGLVNPHQPRFAATIAGRVVPTRWQSEEEFPPDYMHRVPQLPDVDYRGRGI